MIKHVLDNPWVRAGALLGTIIGVCLVAYLMSAVLVPLFFAFIVAYMFDPLIDIFEARKVPRMTAVVGLVVLIIITVCVLPLVLLPNIVSEAEELINVRSDGDGGFIVSAVAEHLPLERLVELLGWVPQGEEPFDPRQVLAQRIGELVRDNARDLAQSYSADLAKAGQMAGASAAEFFKSVGNSVTRVVLFFGNFALFGFVAVYLLKDYDRIVAGIDDLVPPRFRDKVRDIFRRIDRQLRAFLRGQAMVCVCLGTMYAIGLSIAGVPFAIPLAIFGALASFVPYLGIALTIGPAVILCVLEHGFDWHLIATLATFVVAQFLEGNVLTPKIVGSQVGLGPVWVILAIMVFSSTFGFVGLLLAVPLAAVLKVLVAEGVYLYKNSKFYDPPALPPAS
jgi:predicted PurR-regulated permease PerM